MTTEPYPNAETYVRMWAYNQLRETRPLLKEQPPPTREDVDRLVAIVTPDPTTEVPA